MNRRLSDIVNESMNKLINPPVEKTELLSILIKPLSRRPNFLLVMKGKGKSWR